MDTITELDTVALRQQHGRWLAGTTGAVVERLDEHTVLVELVGPDGASLELVPVGVTDLDLVSHANTPHGPGPDRMGS